MKTTPDVSVIMPVFNGERYVGQAISSVLEQSYRNFELVIIDDGSRDSTKRRVERFRDDRIRFYEHNDNQGIAASRNDGLSKAKGPYIAWLDSDDIASPSRLERQLDFLEKNRKYGLCSSNVVSIDAEGRQSSGKWWNTSNIPVDWQMLWTNPIAQSSVMIRKSLLEKPPLAYDPSYSPAEDYHLWCRLVQRSRFYRLDDVLLEYRVLSDSAYHLNVEKALLDSIEANNGLLRALCSREVPLFHKYLTNFASSLPPYQRGEPLASVADWLDSVFMAFCQCKDPGDRERESILADIKERLSLLLQNNPHFPGGSADKFFLLRRYPSSIVRLPANWFLKRLRTARKTVIRKFQETFPN